MPNQSKAASGKHEAISLGPIGISVLIHAALFAVVFVSWQSQSQQKRIATPRYIEAKLVTLKTQSKKAPAKKKNKVIDLTKRRKAEAERKAKQQAAQKRKAAEQAKKKAQAEAKAKEKKRIAEQKAQQQREREKAQQLEQQRRLNELEEALREEEEAAEEALLAEQAQSYIDAISQKIEQNWSRPPSARNGMKCELLIQLVPTGRVVSVTIVNSSGNNAFDRSAEQAVKKAEVFPEIKTMPPQVFEKYYRRLTLIFNPQDLRQ